MTPGFGDDVGLQVQDGLDGPQVRLEAGDRHLNRHGTVHGGVLATMADAAMGAAVRSAGDEKEKPVTVSLTVTYLRPASPGLLTAAAHLRTKGGRLSVVEADIVQAESGESVAHAVATFAITS